MKPLQLSNMRKTLFLKAAEKKKKKTEMKKETTNNSAWRYMDWLSACESWSDLSYQLVSNMQAYTHLHDQYVSCKLNIPIGTNQHGKI